MECLSQKKEICRNISSAATKTIKLFHKLVFEVEGDRNNRKRLRDFEGFQFAADSTEKERKLIFIREHFTDGDLVSVCNVLCMSYDGTKEQLAHRICDGLMDFRKLNKNSDDDFEDHYDDDDKNNDDFRKTENDDLEKCSAMENATEASSDDGKDDSESESHCERRRRRSEHKFVLTFRDVEDSIRSFDGSCICPIEKWIKEFEEMAVLMNWDDLHKLILAKRSLKGLAKLFVQGEIGLTTWVKLKRSLIEEFGRKINSADLHRQLVRRRMTSGESLLEYFLIMKEIASRGDIEDDSLIQYVVDGIDDNSSNKLLLYGAKDIKDFKQRLKDYERVKEKRTTVNVAKDEKSSRLSERDLRFRNKPTSAIRCFNCGEVGHKSLDCKQKHKGSKCFKCNRFGHRAAECDEFEIKEKYFISKLKEKIKNVLANCVVCILTNRKRGKLEGYLHPLNKGSVPLHTYHADHVGPLESTHKGYKHILVVIDSFTKFVWLYPTKSTTTSEVIAKLEIQKTIFGNPVQIVTDRGTAFTSREFEDYCANEKIQHLLITTGLPRANGQVERINSVVISVLSKVAMSDPTKWYKHVSRTQCAINSTFHRSIGMTPFELMVGTKMRTAADLEIAKFIEEEVISSFNKERTDLRDDARSQILRVQEENRRAFNKRRRRANCYKLGDLVAVKHTQFGPGLKLRSKFLGPYRVTKVKSRDTYDVVREGIHEGPKTTSTCSEYMKPWVIYSSSSETNDDQDGRMWDEFENIPPTSNNDDGATGMVDSIEKRSSL